MGEYVKAKELKIGDWWSSLGRGYLARRIDDIRFGHTHRIVDGKTVHTPELIIVAGDLNEHVSPDHREYRQALAAHLDIVPWTNGDESGYDFYANGIHYAHTTIRPDESAWEYIRGRDKDEWLRGYVLATQHLVNPHSGGESKCVSLADLARCIEHQAALDAEKARGTA